MWRAALSVPRPTVRGMTDVVTSELCCAVLELRQYTLRPGRRDELIELFDRELLTPQEDGGMRVLGQFRDLDAPDRFVWLRGFADMGTRAAALADFYGGPVWRAHREAANATMIDSDDVLLLRPIDHVSDFALPGPAEGPVPRDHLPDAAPSSVFAVTVYPLPVTGPADVFWSWYLHTAEPVLIEAGARPLARLRTEAAENTFPALPVRAGANVAVTVAAFDSVDRHAEHQRRLAASPRWTDEVRPMLRRLLAGEPQALRLSPTARSLLR